MAARSEGSRRINGCARIRPADRLTRPHRGHLKPVNADGLLVARLFLEADIHIVAALQHLLGGLREAGFIAVNRRNGEEAGQKSQKANDHKQERGAPMTARCPAHQTRET